MRRVETAACLILAALLCAGTVRADVMNLPMPSDYVTDYAGIVGAPERSQLNALLQELERKTGAQVLVVTVKSLEGNPIENVSLHLAHDLWKLGQKGKDNGLLILIAPAERKYRIEVGYGLEAILPDSAVGSIGRECFVPNFRSGNYGLGIVQAAGEIARRIASASGVALTNVPQSQPQPVAVNPGRSIPGILIIVGFVGGLLLLRVLGWYLAYCAARGWWSGGRSSGSGGAGSSWSGGGGFSGGFGGGGGSFGGGGGGGFGGGGASGGW